MTTEATLLRVGVTGHRKLSPDTAAAVRGHVDAVLAAARSAVAAVQAREADWHAADPPRLYLKPEDRWEVNDVAQQFPDEVEALLKRYGPNRAAN